VAVAGVLLITSMKTQASGGGYVAAAFALADGDVEARILRVLHALEVDQAAVRIDDRHGDVPVVLPRTRR